MRVVELRNELNQESAWNACASGAFCSRDMLKVPVVYAYEQLGWIKKKGGYSPPSKEVNTLTIKSLV